MHRHGHLLVGVGVEQPLDEEVPHDDADKYAAVVHVLLLRAVVQLEEADVEVQLQLVGEDLLKLPGAHLGFVPVRPVEAVVVEGDAVDHRDEEERPVRTALALRDVAVVVDRQEDVRHVLEVRERFDDRRQVLGAQQQERHARAEEADPRLRVLREDLSLKPFLPKRDVLLDTMSVPVYPQYDRAHPHCR